MLNLGIIGCGRGAETLHLPVLRTLPGMRIVGIVDDDKDRETRVVDGLHIRQRYRHYSDLLTDPAIEAVAAWVPPNLQLEIVQAVLKAGKHLFVDKPLVFDLKAWDDLIQQAASADRIVMVGFPRRWHRLILRAREVIRQGRLKRLRLIRTVSTGIHPEKLGLQEADDGHLLKDALFHFGIHHFDLWHFLLERDTEEVFAMRGADRSAVAVSARMSDGQVVSSTFQDGSTMNDEVEIYGDAGHFRVSCYRYDGFEYFPPASHPGDMQLRLRHIAQSLSETPAGLLRMRHGGDFFRSYRTGWQHFLDSVRCHRRPDCTLEDGLRALRVVLAASESAVSGRPVAVAYTGSRGE